MFNDRFLKILKAELCPYCGSCTKRVSETDVYGKEYKGREIIVCVNFPKCDSYVGTHKDGEPLGRLASKLLREERRKAHLNFDKIWREEIVDRSDLYKELSEFLQIPGEYTHIGMFSKSTCIKVQEWSKKRYTELKNDNNTSTAVN